ncbi:MAG: exonuclease domain-containing protein [Verrucomicrobiales bacterium]
MPLIRDTEFVAVDFESAGVTRGSTDAPVQIAWAGMRGTEVQPESFFASYLHSDSPIAWSAQKVHGISRDDLCGAPTLASLWPRLRSGLAGKVVVAHGAGTEKRFLRAFPLHGFGPWLDTVVLSRRFLPDLADHSLGSLCDALQLTPEVENLVPDGRWHHALFDAVASLLVLRQIVVELGQEAWPIEDLLISA